jgi:hypothetical protein
LPHYPLDIVIFTNIVRHRRKLNAKKAGLPNRLDNIAKTLLHCHHHITLAFELQEFFEKSLVI